MLASCAGASPPSHSEQSTDALRLRTDSLAAALREIVPPDDPRVWQRIRAERIATLLPRAMDAAGVDAWVTLVRENDNDPLALHVGGENAGGTAGILFFRREGGVESIALSPAGEATALDDLDVHDVVVPLERGDDVYARIAEEIKRRNPGSIAINSSSRAAADGLSHTQRLLLEKALGPDLARRLTSSEELVVRWLSVKTPEEVDIMRAAAAVTSALEEEAYSIIVPGVTRDFDVAALLKRRMRQLGFEDAWAADQNPAVNSGPDRGHTHATDRVIQRGDFIQTDFGIKVGGIWSTDIQRFAYVLPEGRTTPPDEALQRWEIARKGNRIALRAMRPGVRGYDVDAAQRAWMTQNGSEPVPWSTGHPVGYWAHDMGPSLGGAQRGAPAAGESLRTLERGQTFAFDGFFAWPLEGGGTKTISVEEMAVVTADGAEYLIEPQESLILVH